MTTPNEGAFQGTSLIEQATVQLNGGSNGIENFIGSKSDDRKMQLNEIKKNMAEMIDAMTPAPNFFTRCSLYWAKVPIGLQVLIGIVLVVPMMTLGIIVHFIPLITLSVIISILFSACWFFLDNHFSNIFKAEGEFQKIMNVTVDVLGNSLDALDGVCVQLGSEVDEFQQENIKLKNEVAQLIQQVEQTAGEAKKITQIAADIQIINENLQQANTSLEHGIKEQKEKVFTTQAEIRKITRMRDANEKAFETKIHELDDEKSKISVELVGIEGIIKTLKETIVILSKSVLSDEQSRRELQSKLEKFLETRQQNYEIIANKIRLAKEELSEVKDRYAHSNQRYKDLLSQLQSQLNLEKEQLERLEELISGKKPSANNISALLAQSLFSGVNSLNSVNTISDYTLEII